VDVIAINRAAGHDSTSLSDESEMAATDATPACKELYTERLVCCQYTVNSHHILKNVIEKLQ
jgi:hypothetical protein